MTVFRPNSDPNPTVADAAQIAALPHDGTTAPPVAQPFPDGDKALADSINELKTKDADYARLRTEDAREEWENVTRANLQRQQSQAQNQKDKAGLQEASTQGRDDLHDGALLKHATELAATLPDQFTEYTLPVDQLREVVKTQQELDAAAKRRGQPGIDGVQPALQPTNDETFADGELYKLTNNPDGSVELKLATGERFVGDPMTVMQKVAESKVYTTRYAKDLKSKLQTSGSAPVPSGDGGEISEFGQWAADDIARNFGFSDRNELVQWGSKINQTVNQQNEFIETQKLRGVTADFMARCPDFPGTPDAINALGTMIVTNNWATTADNMEAAHAHLLRTRVYSPLTPAEQRATVGGQTQQNRPAPPPMLRSSSPDANQRVENPYTEPLEEMRKRIIRGQLEQAGLEYR